MLPTVGAGHMGHQLAHTPSFVSWPCHNKPGYAMMDSLHGPTAGLSACCQAAADAFPIVLTLN
jgi:hypothetical protein